MVYYNSKILKHNANIPHKNTQVQITELIHIFHKKMLPFVFQLKNHRLISKIKRIFRILSNWFNQSVDKLEYSVYIYVFNRFFARILRMWSTRFFQ